VPDDHHAAARYAESAGRVLLELRDDATRPAWALGDAGDAVANRHLIELIRRDHPDDPILSEESADDRRRLDADRVWIIDPLDGTREYAEPGRRDWAVHVALWQRDEGLVAGRSTWSCPPASRRSSPRSGIAPCGWS
jgi:3'(2'), 5'-bisphosphate nucleotidase